MNIIEGLKSIEFDKNERKIFGIKSGILWGHSNKSNSSFPLLYISKPKNITEEDYKLLLSRLEINLLQ